MVEKRKKETLEGCHCLVEYEKHLLISALASYKAELNIFLGKPLPYDVVKLLQSRVSHIDEIIEKVEMTPRCPTQEEEETIKRRLAGYSG